MGISVQPCPECGADAQVTAEGRFEASQSIIQKHAYQTLLSLEELLKSIEKSHIHGLLISDEFLAASRAVKQARGVIP